METIKKTDEFIIKSYGRLPVVIVSGKGDKAIDENGREYIDFGSGIGVNSLGYCDDEWCEAICKQSKTLQHTSNYYYTKPAADFAEKLCNVTGYESVFLCNSGAEANECAIKLARKYSFDKYGNGNPNTHKRNKIITLTGSFHGRTIATLTATGQEDKHNFFFPFVDGFSYTLANDPVALAEKLGDDVCAVMLEYIQGEGGVIPLEQDFVDLLYMLCKEKDILIIADEVQTGAGRTGAFLSGEHYSHRSDITTMAKGLFGGLPGGACLANKKCSSVLTAGTHGSTFGGNPVVAAGGNVILEKITDKEFLCEVKEKGEYLKQKLLENSEIEGISGKGLMIGISLKKKKAQDVLKSALEKGLFVLTAGDKIRLLPPLNISYETIDKGIEILMEII